MSDGSVSVLYVCHANLCRSPLAERLAELAAARRLPAGGTAGAITFSSAGTDAYAGDPMHRHAVRVLSEYGASTRPFFSRRVDPTLLGRATLVLTATREQRAHCVRAAPAIVRRAFTLREFGRLCGAVGEADLPAEQSAERAVALVDAAAAARGRFQPVPAHQDDLADPVARPLDAFRTCAGEVWSVLSVITGLLIADPAARAHSR
ncbi:MAG TPA: low molecular weight phosphatase family protein [Micromonosporaceae bacterium]|nr:low molecular weight phosphatase family protein [Micromonosporaceae bacterium]